MDGEPPQEEDFSQIPLVERSQHKNWKARLSAYTDIIAKSAKTASDTDPFFRAYVSDGTLLKKWVLDPNVVAQEKGIEAVHAIVQNSGESSSRTRPDVVPALVEKALGAARAGTKRKAGDLCALYVEVENGGEGVVTDVLVGLDTKQPKVVAGCVACLKETIETFGIPAMGNTKLILKTLGKVFGHSDKTVRAEGTALTLVLYTYLGPALQASLADLKPVQVTELQKTFDSLDAKGKGAGTGRPTRWTRKVQREREAAPGEGSEDAAVEVAAPIDTRSLLDPVNILSKFPSDLEERLASAKWKDRLEALEECSKILGQPQNARISDAGIDAYGTLASTLGAKCKGDANVNVVIEAAKVIEGLAGGIGRPFGRFRGVTMPLCLERLKERKATVVEALGRALDALFSTTTLSDIMDDVLASLKSKNPQVKEGTLKFLHRSLQTTTDPPSKDQVKPMAEILVALLGDSTEPVRASAAECLGTIMKILGERTFNPYVESVGELQMAKVKDAFATAEIRYRAGAKGPANAGAKPSAVKKAPASKPAVASSPPLKPASMFPPIKPSSKMDPEDTLDGFAPNKAAPGRTEPPVKPSSNSPPKIAVPRPPTSSTTTSKGPSKALAAAPTEPVKYRYSPEEATAHAAEVIPADYHTKLSDPAWKTRLETAEELVTWVGEGGGAAAVESEVMMRFLGKTPGWGEKNFQVSAKVYHVMALMAEKSPSFGRSSAALAIGPLTDRLGDLKLKKPAGDALTAFAEKTSLAFVLTQGYDPMTKQKAPKAQADALSWIKQQLTDFGTAGLPLRDLITFVQVGLGSPNAQVRQSATSVLVTVKIFLGADISGFLEDLNPQLLATINSEFEKVAGQTPPEPVRQQADLRDVAAGPSKSKGSDPLDDLVPRVDLDKLVSQTTVIADSKADAWKTRKEAFDSLNVLLEVKSNSRLKPTMGEISSVLKKAMGDTNLAVKMLALGIISKIAIGMGPPFEKHARLLTQAVASVCADQKTTTRSAALATLSAMGDASGGLDSMFSGLASSLESTNPALRASVLGWLAERLQADTPSASADLSPMAAPVLSCLEDRNGDVRKGAGAVLPFVVSSAGFDFVMDQASNLKPASKATIVPLINNARSAAPTSTAAGPSKTPAATSKPAKPSAVRDSPVRPRAPAAPAKSLAMKALSSAPTTRPTSIQGDEKPSAKPRPATVARPMSVVAPASSSRTAPFLAAPPEARGARLKKDSARWMLEPSPKHDLFDYLAQQMESHTSPEAFALLFSKDHRAEEDFMVALSLVADFYDQNASAAFEIPLKELSATQLANVDLAVKYAALRLLSNNTQMANRCFDVISHVIETLQRCNERFSDAEAKLFVPALIIKLGDTKFATKLAPVFESLDRIIAGSQVVQLLVQYGLEDKSAGKTCKNESLQLIEKAYRKRGSILRAKDDKGFCEAVARCIADPGTRSAALSVMALLQLQGGSSSLTAVVEAMPQGSKDMLANRRAAMATTKTGGAASIAARALGEATESVPSPARLKRPVVGSPAVSRLPREVDALRTIPRSVVSPSSKLPRANAVSPAKTLPAPSQQTSAAGVVSRLQRPMDPLPLLPNGKLSMQPLSRRPPSNGHDTFDPMTRLINDIRQDDMDRTLDALKELQVILADDPEKLLDNAQTLVDTLVDEMEQAFTPPENLRDPRHFRLVKHIIQTFSGLSSCQDLMRRLSYDDVYAMFFGLTLRLVQADAVGGTVQELSRFINLIVVQVLSTPDRLLVFKVMFRLLLFLVKDFVTLDIQPDSEIAIHADLVLKCMWKRSKILEDDLRTGRLRIGSLMAVLEEFLQGVGPAEFRRRAREGVALGDMPLRTVKTIIQRILVYVRDAGLEIYDILLGEFGDAASDTVVYSYVFRLVGTEPASSAQSNGSSDRAISRTSQAVSNTNTTSPPNRLESEAERLVRSLREGGYHTTQLDALYAYLKANPDKENDIHSAISTQLKPNVQTYVWRTIETRRGAEQNLNPSPARTDLHASASPLRSSRSEHGPSGPAGRALPRKSMAARPSSLAVDAALPADEQIAAYKGVFARAKAMSSGQGPEERSVGEPLSERAVPNADSSID